MNLRLAVLIRVLFAVLLTTPPLGLLPGQGGQLPLDRINSRNGLSANYVTCLYQDATGFLWVGTYDGLNRYDGYDVRVSKPDPAAGGSISGILVFDITGDAAGNLWIGTTGSGLNYYDRSTDRYYPILHRTGEATSLLTNTVNALVIDRDNYLWVGTDEGISRTNLSDYVPGQDPVFEHFLAGERGRPHFIQTLFQDDSGTVWAATRRGIYRRPDRPGAPFQRMDATAVSDFRVKCISQGADGHMLVAGANGFFYQNTPGVDDSFVLVGDKTQLNALAVDRSTNQVWVGGESGLQQYELLRGGAPPRLVSSMSAETGDQARLTGDDVTSLLVDRSQVVWIGTNGSGINKYDPLRKQFRHVRRTEEPGGLSSNAIRSITQGRDGRIWVGTDGGGINVSDGPLDQNRRPRFRAYPRPDRAYTLLEVRNATEEALYIGTNTGPGLYRLDLSRPGAQPQPQLDVPASVFASLEDRDGNLWFGSYSDGLHRWVPSPEEPGGYRKSTIGFRPGQAGSLPSPIVRGLLQDRNGNLWVGTARGLAVLEQRQLLNVNPTFTVYQNVVGDPSSLSQNYILPLFEASDGTIWVGTFGGGLNRYVPPAAGEERGSFVTYGEKDGLRNGVIKAIQEDDSGKLWISTNKGLSRLDPRDNSVANFDYYDGLQDDEFGELAAVRQQDGTMIFGGVNGMTVFRPAAIRQNPYPARPVLTGLAVQNQDVAVGQEYGGAVILPTGLNEADHITLSHNQDNFSLEFAALHFAAPDNNLFAYRLEGYDEDWIYTTATERRATYTNLPPRDYTFLLRVSNNDGVWTEEPLRLGITVLPPFYRTTWAYLLYALAFAGLLYLFRRYSIIDAEEKGRLQLKRVSQEKTEELNQLKLQFFTNVSHEFRTPLTLITGPLENLIREQDTMSDVQRGQYYHLMYKNSKYLLRLVNQLLDFRRLDQGQLALHVSKNDIVSFVEETAAPFEFLATKKNIDFRLDIDERPIGTWFDPDALEKILFNLLSNAFKFTPDGGRITVRIGKTTPDDRRFKTHLPGYGAVLISVSDTGPGMDRRQLRNIFNRFYKSTQEGTANREGTGIGLAYTKALIDNHRGLINVDSTPGKGSTFYLRLSLDKNLYSKSELERVDLTDYVPKADPVDYFMPEENIDEAALNDLQLRSSQLLQRQAPEETPLLLYIDDNADLRNYIRQSFGGDYRIIAADGGVSGLELARTSSPDIIVCDVMMPDLDGMQVLAAIKADPATSHIPVIMLTAKDTEDSLSEGLRHGADGYVTKPFRHDLLLQQINNIVQRRDVLRNRFRREVITEPAEVTVTDTDEVFLRQAMDIVEENMSNTEFSVDQLVKEMGVSRSKLYLKLKALTGQSSSEFVRTVRLKRAVRLLEDSNYSVKEVMYMTGFNTASYFSKCFKRQFGIVPSEYVKQRRATSD